MKLKVVLNGTSENPYHKMGLKQNPFTQTGKAEYDDTALRKLGSDPIPSTDYIREVLVGWSQEFIDLCCRQFVPGEIVRFEVEFEERRASWR
jgi:hypothetical protein